jgi:predicted PurR-regulated permease PerM
MTGLVNYKNSAYFFVTAISTVFILSIGKNIIIPFVFALLIWLIIKQMRHSMNRIKFVKNRFPEWVKNSLSFLIILLILNFIINIVYSNFRILVNSYERYASKIDALIISVNDTFNIDLKEQINVYLEDFDFSSVALSLFNYSFGLMGTIFVVIVYTLFILLEESTFKKKLEKVFPEQQKFKDTYSLIGRIERSVSKYLVLKTLICLATSVLSYIAFIIIGVDFPVFWAFLIFILNYIPIIGSYVATFTPVVFSILQFGSFLPGLMVLLSVGTVQIVIGNFIDPRIMGNRVNLSPLVIILSLSFWGAIWGVIGMFLSVPLMVIVVITFSKIPQFRPVAILMSRSGNLN